MSLTYAKSGVNQVRKDAVIERILKMIRRTHSPAVIDLPWGFAGLYSLGRNGLREPVLVACADGVGTKLRLAVEAGILDTVGIDLVAMNVNDLIVTGGTPLFFLDYISTAAVKPVQLLEIMKGIVAGCRQAGCALLGGETAEMPGMLAREDDVELAGFAVGIVDRKQILDGSTVRPGDLLIGLPSSGVHSNGYSLVRKIIGRTPLGSRIAGLGGTLGRVLLAPTRIYVRSVQSVLRRHPIRTQIRAMAHITGGGIGENLPRVLPRGCAAEIVDGSWPIPPIFDYLQRRGGVSRAEMFRVFNMGVGMILVVSSRHADAVLRTLHRSGERAHVVGRIVKGTQGVRIRTSS